MKTTKTSSIPKLPDGILASDLKYPSGPQRVWGKDFELWFVTGFGWCIPTLTIRNASRRETRGYARRTYAVRVETGTPCRIGQGPHVTARVTVYASKKREKALAKYFALQTEGESVANQMRDRISTRRLRSSMGGWDR